jgi:4-hydroxybutyrate CoA-transferase
MRSTLEKLKYKQNWESDFKRKMVTPEEAVRVVNSGDYVVTPLPDQPAILMEALAARAPELKNVTVQVSASSIDPGWAEPHMKDSFNIVAELFIGSRVRPAMDEKRITYLPDLFSLRYKGIDEGRKASEKFKDFIFFTPVSLPDANGFCSFGASMWNKRSYAKRARCVVGEIQRNAIRTYGTNYIHVSEIDYFVEPEVQPDLTEDEWANVYKMFYKKPSEEIYSKFKLSESRVMRLILEVGESMGFEPAGDFMAPHFGLDEPSEAAIGIANNLKGLIRDGATIQVGVGRPSVFMVKLGVFDERNDLGIHTEMGAPGIADLVKRGIVNGKYKTLHPGKAVFSTLAGCDAEDIEFADNNPAFELYDSDYVANVLTTAKHDNMTSVNNCLQIDLTGQINSESQFGNRMINGQGGQTELHIGAMLSKGGRAISLLPSTTMGGVSTIVPQLDEGALVTIPRQFADTIVSEYGVARLLDKTHRERAAELINIAHPDHRDFLRDEAKNLFG